MTVLDEQSLLQLGPSFDLGQVRAHSAQVALVSEGEARALRVTTDPAAEWPSIELPAPGGHWDLSPFLRVLIELQNLGQEEVTVSCRLDSPGTESTAIFRNDLVTLGPGQSGAVRALLRRAAPEWMKGQLFGMSGYPGNYRPRGIDVAHVEKLVICVGEPTRAHAIEITSVRAQGQYGPPSDLLQDPAKFLPFIDEFGQYLHDDWPGKTHAPADLAQARTIEAKDLAAHSGPTDRDVYGGWKDGPTLAATGWFHVRKHEGQWWLVDPAGKLFFSHGLACMNPKAGITPIDDRAAWFQNLPAPDPPFKECYSRAKTAFGRYQNPPMCFDFGVANLLRKYGTRWREAFAALAHQRLRSWGFNTIGNWSEAEVFLQDQTPYVVPVHFTSKPLQGTQGWRIMFRDVFDEDFRAQVRQALAAAAKDTAGDRWCIGYFVDNEQAWGENDEALAVATLASPREQAAKRIFIEDLRAKYATIENLNAVWGTSHDSWEALLKSTQQPDRRKAGPDLVAFHTQTVDRYFQTIRAAVREAAPHHLYLGCRFTMTSVPGIAGCSPSAAAAAARHCDVVSCNLYRHSVTDFRLPAAADVPLLIGEFSFGATDRGMFHPGPIPVATQAERAECYKAYVRGALHHPQFVGCHWFQYMAQATTGRMGDGENLNLGILDIADTPYWETVNAAREIGAQMYDYRWAGK